MTKQQVELLRLGISPIDDRTILNCEAGLEWVLQNTTLVFDVTKDEDLQALPACVRLFLVKFNEVQNISEGVSSESIDGLSQSFDTSDKSTLIWQFAEEFLYGYLKGRVRFVQAQKRWY